MLKQRQETGKVSYQEYQLSWLISGSASHFSISNFSGDFIVPNFEEIWPSGKNKKQPAKSRLGMDYLLEATQKGIPGERNKMFTTVGKPAVQ